MSDMSDFMETSVLNVYLRGQTYTGGQVYAALFTAAPTDAGGGTECSYSGYARQTFGATPSSAWSAPSGGQSSNTALLQFAAIAGGAITVVAMAIFDAVSGGNMLLWKALTSSVTFNNTDIPQFPIGGVVVAMQ